MTPREQQRVQVLTQVQHRALEADRAAGLLGLSVRHVRRLLAGLRQRGIAAVVHGNRGRMSSRRLADAIRAKICRLARTRYAGCNDHQFTEFLAEREGLRLSRPLVRLILRQAGIPSPRSRRAPRHRRRRERMPQAGLLVQMDGSHHPWLGTRGPRLVLLAALDDATGRVLAALFRLQEDTHGYFQLLATLIARHGIPTALYTDRHHIFQPDPRTPPTVPEQLRGVRDRTQFSRALQELGIRWIPAQSPQAKGRIERLFGTFQDRLVTELRLQGAETLDAAQRVLIAFLPRYNRRFARPPAHPDPAWRPAPARAQLKAICCFKYERTVANDNTILLQDRLLHLAPGPAGRSYARARVEVRIQLDATLAVYYLGQRLEIRTTTLPTKRLSPQLRYGPMRPPQPILPPGPRRWSAPARDHPWRRDKEAAARRKQFHAQQVAVSCS